MSGKKKRSLGDKLINAFAILILMFFVANEFSHLYRTLHTIDIAPDLYEHHYSTSSTFPFVGSYYLMKPKNYDPQYKYPLVVVLHGVSTRAYAAEALATPKFRSKYPFFVMVPIAPKRAFWATPNDKAYQMQRNIPYPDHLPQVMAGIEDIKQQYNIDENKLIISGHSMGASGVIGALQRYPEYFNAGIASSGAWSPNELDKVKTPLFIYHGSKDSAVPMQNSVVIKQAARKMNLPISVTFLKRQRHGIGPIVYGNQNVWNDVMSVVR